MEDEEQIIIDGVVYYKQQDINEGLDEEHYITEFHLLATHYNLLLEDYARKTQECEELKDKMADVIYVATGGRLSYSSYTLDAIEQAFNDQLEILSDQKVEEEIKELNQKLYLIQNEVHSKTEYIQEQREEIKQLEQKNEELKEYIQANKPTGICETCTAQTLIQNDKYRKTLKEIEIYCKTAKGVATNKNDIEFFQMITDIINKGKDVNNE